MNLYIVIFFIFTTASSASQARDSTGYLLLPGAAYYLASVIRGPGGGGLTLSSFLPNPNQCPNIVTQEPSDLSLGLPCIFLPSNPADATVRLKSSLNIVFSNVSSICPNVTTLPWQVGQDGLTQTRLVMTGGTTGSPGCPTAANWFRIGKGSYKWSYRLLYDPSDVCRTLMGTYHLRVRDVLGKRVLSVSSSGEALEFVFIKAATATATAAGGKGYSVS